MRIFKNIFQNEYNLYLLCFLKNDGEFQFVFNKGRDCKMVIYCQPIIVMRHKYHNALVSARRAHLIDQPIKNCPPHSFLNNIVRDISALL